MHAYIYIYYTCMHIHNMYDDQVIHIINIKTHV